ncbi:MAG: thioredoxin fold domain-containing protein [Candidatus Lokiarchaeota archaeon]|nr:thioredoxin fold domain-containing protein [Candidatus Lokiarchaeota archaeon]
MVEYVDKRQMEQIIQNHDVVLVDFSSKFCGPCQFQHKELDKLKHKLGDKIKIISVEMNRNPDLAIKYNIRATPTLMFFKNGKKIRFKSRSQGRMDRFIGLRKMQQMIGPANYLISMKN